MKISTRGRYGLKVVVDIAQHIRPELRCISLKSSAERLGISENYLEQIVAPLKKADVLRSVRGAGGGYYLARPADALTVGEILRILEGNLAPTDCATGNDDSCGESDCGSCPSKSVWRAIFENVNQVVDSVTVADLIKDFDEKIFEREG
ncbi:MAG: Rrf2 family transcriptional regulator [Defluviitaleaceae bacterium]|nr:Rrf2 family transcriptional regulator [Defluviitaleaceae bacterium]